MVSHEKCGFHGDSTGFHGDFMGFHGDFMVMSWDYNRIYDGMVYLATYSDLIFNGSLW